MHKINRAVFSYHLAVTNTVLSKFCFFFVEECKAFPPKNKIKTVISEITNTHTQEIQACHNYVRLSVSVLVKVSQHHAQVIFDYRENRLLWFNLDVRVNSSKIEIGHLYIVVYQLVLHIHTQKKITIKTNKHTHTLLYISILL